MENEEVIINDEVDEITRAQRMEAAKVSNKPMIDHLPDAIGKDELGLPVLLAAKGDQIIIERIASVLTHKPWLDTKTYTIESIDMASGNISLWDEDLHRSALSNFIEGVKHGYRFKLPTRKGMNIGQKKRGRPRKNPTEVPEAKPVELDANGQPIKKKRGRPPGVKNRDKDVIKAEKKAKVATKNARVEKRKKSK